MQQNAKPKKPGDQKNITQITSNHKPEAPVKIAIKTQYKTLNQTLQISKETQIHWRVTQYLRYLATATFTSA